MKKFTKKERNTIYKKAYEHFNEKKSNEFVCHVLSNIIDIHFKEINSDMFPELYLFNESGYSGAFLSHGDENIDTPKIDDYCHYEKYYIIYDEYLVNRKLIVLGFCIAMTEN